jgi:uncharacterized Zn-binding protein involved in type VI secretion
MAAPMQRVGDFNSGGGIIVSGGHRNVLVNGRPAATPFAVVTPHIGCGKKNLKSLLHCLALTLPGSSTVKINGEPVIVTGVPDTCGHSRAGGSPNVVSAGGAGLIGQALSLYNTVSSLQNLASRLSAGPLDIQPGEGL